MRLAFATRTLSVFLLTIEDRCHMAMVRFPSQPAKKGALQQLGIEPIRLCSAMFARNSNTRRVNDITLNVMCSQPARQPKFIAASLIGNDNPGDHPSSLGRLVAPPVQEFQQPILAGSDFLQWVAFQSGYNLLLNWLRLLSLFLTMLFAQPRPLTT
jgi:hypothetical protein